MSPTNFLSALIHSFLPPFLLIFLHLSTPRFHISSLSSVYIASLNHILPSSFHKPCLHHSLVHCLHPYHVFPSLPWFLPPLIRSLILFLSPQPGSLHPGQSSLYPTYSPWFSDSLASCTPCDLACLLVCLPASILMLYYRFAAVCCITELFSNALWPLPYIHIIILIAPSCIQDNYNG